MWHYSDNRRIQCTFCAGCCIPFELLCRTKCISSKPLVHSCYTLPAFPSGKAGCSKISESGFRCAELTSRVLQGAHNFAMLEYCCRAITIMVNLGSTTGRHVPSRKLLCAKQFPFRADDWTKTPPLKIVSKIQLNAYMEISGARFSRKTAKGKKYCEEGCMQNVTFNYLFAFVTFTMFFA